MSRLVLTKIDLISDNFIPRDLLRSWMTTGSRCVHAYQSDGRVDASKIEIITSHSSTEYVRVSCAMTGVLPDVHPACPTSCHWNAHLFKMSALSHLQLFAVNLLRTVLKGADMANREPKSVAALSSATSAARSNDGCWEEWCIETLVTQLNGENPKVARAALSVLEEATQDEGCLRTLVCLRRRSPSPFVQLLNYRSGTARSTSDIFGFTPRSPIVSIAFVHDAFHRKCSDGTSLSTS